MNQEQVFPLTLGSKLQPKYMHWQGDM